MDCVRLLSARGQVQSAPSGEEPVGKVEVPPYSAAVGPECTQHA